MHRVSLHFDVNRILAVSYFCFLKSNVLWPVVNSHHGLAASLGFNSDMNIYNYCYPAWLIIGKSCSVVLSNTPCRRSLNEAGRLILGSDSYVDCPKLITPGFIYLFLNQ